jgi:hypothetical protein
VAKFRGPRLKSLENIRAFVAKTLRQVERGEMDVEQAKINLSGARVLTEIISAQSVERRNAEIEALTKRAIAMQAEMEQLREARARTVELPPHHPQPVEPDSGEGR